MLAITEEAATTIDDIIAASELPEGAGVRLSLEMGEYDGERRPGIRFDVVGVPESGDEVLEDAPVFLEPEAAAVLEDKLLDADVDGDQVRFAVRQQG